MTNKKKIAILGIGGIGDMVKLVMEAAADVSLDDIQSNVYRSLCDQFGTADGGWAKYSPVEVFADYVIARGPDGDLYKIPYSTDPNDDDKIIFGDMQEVEEVFLPVQQSAKFVIEGASEDDGYTWPVQIVEEGWANGTVEGQTVPHYFAASLVAEFASAVNDARFGRRHPSTPDEVTDPSRIAGFFTDGKLVGKTAQAKLHLLKSETELRDRLVAARDAGQAGLFGLSVLAAIGFKSDKVDGQKALVGQKLVKLFSVDLVTEAGAGGKFLSSKMVAASRSTMGEISRLQTAAVKQNSSRSTGGTRGAANAGREGAQMKNRILKVLEALRKHNAGRAAELETELNGLAEDKYSEFILKVTEAASDEIEKASTAVGSTTTATVKETLAEAQKVMEAAQKLQSSNLVETKLTESKLAEPLKKLVREAFTDKVVVGDVIDAEIKRVREAFAAMSTTGRVNGDRIIAMGLDSVDKVQLAMDGMFGVKEALGKGVTPFTSIRKAYAMITGDSELMFGKDGRGGFMSKEAAIATTDFPNLLLNSMTKKAIQDYAEIGMNGVERLFTKATVTDYKTQDRIRDGYFADLPSVNQNAAYGEADHPTDEKISYTIGKYGELLTISEETIRNDDLGKVLRFPTKIARAGRRTLKQYVTNFFVNNPAFDPDSVTLFHATHSNLGSAALSIDELVAREVALMKQTEKDSGKRLGLRLAWLMVPVDLSALAYKINNSEFYNPGPAIQEPNPFYKRFGQNGENIIVNELLTDTNDWYCGADLSAVPCIEVGFLDGIEEPQIFIDNNPASGSVAFTNDQIRYKVKMVFGGDVVDYRSAQKNVVP